MSKKRVKSAVSGEVQLLSSLVFRAPSVWKKLGQLESAYLRERLDAVEVKAPIYVTGLARSGTTILLEYLARHAETASHVYRDFPMLFTPYGWHRFQQLAAGGKPPAGALAERTHRDGIKVGPDSPEAMEEPLWMHFFEGLHDSEQSSVLGTDTQNSAFETFYDDHVRKLLLIRRGSRYLAKGNYNLSRMPYLLKLYPDARFVVPVRDPVWHIASLRKQQRLFDELEEKDPAVLQHMCRVGHYEFGQNLAPVNYSNTPDCREFFFLREQGEEVRAWALYWNAAHEFLLEQLLDPATGPSILVVDYEGLCGNSPEWLARILDHSALPQDEALIQDFSERLQPPSYYDPGFSAEELGIIRELTGSTYEQLRSAVRR